MSTVTFCHHCNKELYCDCDTHKKLKYIREIEARFYSWILSEPQEIDFAWLCKTLKEELDGSK